MIWTRQKQLFRGVFKKSCSENMQQIYRRTAIVSVLRLHGFLNATQHSCSNINKRPTEGAKQFQQNCKQLYWNHTSTCVSPVLHIFKTLFSKNTSGQLLLTKFQLSMKKVDQISTFGTFFLKFFIQVLNYLSYKSYLIEGD